MPQPHAFAARVVWTGNRGGAGTADYRAYGRDHEITSGIVGKPAIPGSSDPKFRGDASRYNPEELLVASLSACHLLWYLHLCADSGVVVTGYEDAAAGTMILDADGGGHFAEVVLRPMVTIRTPNAALAETLHERAHALCFIARSVNFPVRCEPVTRVLPALLEFALEKWREEPEMRIADAYKWLFHATQGGEHAVTDASDADGPRGWMDREWETLGPPPPSPSEPLLEPLGPEPNAIVRLHLRPYRAQGGDKVSLLNAFVRSAQAFRPDRHDFTRLWRFLGDALAVSPLGSLTRDEWERLDGAVSPQGYPAIHHSAAYEAARRPAYRVLTASEAQTLVGEL